MKTTALKANPKNPRIIRDDKFKKLVASIEGFPEMMEKRPMVCVTDVDGKLFPLGGNMRLRAIQELGMKEIPDSWVTLADDWTQEKRAEFTIKDNASFGEWNYDDLANEWDAEQLSDWGVDVPMFADDAEEFGEKNKEVDVDGLDGEMTIKLTYSEEDYWKVKEALAKVAATPELAVYELLKL
jgi:ParB-like chromosome segregation protein Spo0J